MALTVSLSLLLVSCQGMQGQTTAGDYASNCAKGVGIGVIGAIGFEAIKQASNLKQGKIDYKSAIPSVAIGAGAGCAVGLAYTAIGQILTDREQQRQDEVFQKAAQAGAEQAERDRLQIEERYRTMPPPATDSDRVAREQAKQREIQTAQAKQGSPQTYTEDGTRGEATYIGTSTSPKTGEIVRTKDGKDCVKIREMVWKNGEQRQQESDACRSADGHYTRMELSRT